jgi:hypothetical protein
MRIYYKVLMWLIRQVILERLPPMAFMDLNKDGSVDVSDLAIAKYRSMK